MGKIKSILKSKVTIGVASFLLGAIIMSGGTETNVNPTEVKTLSDKVATLETEKAELQSKVDKAKPWFEMDELEQQKLKEQAEKEKKAKEEEEAKLKAQKEAEEKAKKEAEEQAKKEAEAKKYETGLTYEDLARNPDKHIGKGCRFSGKVIQVMNGDGYNQYRIAIDDNYDKVMLIEITKDKLTDGNILEDDYLTIEGLSLGVVSYKTVLGAEMSIPAVTVDNFKLN